ncbi:hypothetical protein CROQUDRAFT_553663 [Cronartium quercuum f. sp. fusiforme G11]|uniref:Uncharacterized protein n=1 Tax=Cronartium quercuum f. sp. fusiforme G11 TaxID=708437 RepID=A0A9P6NLR9_9BASI|nr:hypothetical protein CROQUDRAFT_553663 [Cronartium quercuum f. sp. fusiforme G11]
MSHGKRSYKAPVGYKPVCSLESNEPFQVSSLNVSQVRSNELWVVRLPPGIRSKHLENLTLDLSRFNNRSTDDDDDDDENNNNKSPTKVGELEVGITRYDVYVEEIISSSVTKSTSTIRSVISGSSPEVKEVSRLVPMIPSQDKSQSHIIQAPVPVSKVIFFRRRIDLIPSIQQSQKRSNLDQDEKLPNKRVQPSCLETRNVPYGAETDGFEYDRIFVEREHHHKGVCETTSQKIENVRL